MTFTQLAGIYGFDSLYSQDRTGSGVTIAVYELGSYDNSDIDTFMQCYGIDVPIRQVLVDGVSGQTGPTPEPTLDIEDVAALAPGASLEVYEGPNTTVGPIDTFDRIASDDSAKVVSTSWGQCETMNTPTHGGNAQAEATIFAEMAAQGQTMVAAVGDSGSEGCYEATATRSRDTRSCRSTTRPASPQSPRWAAPACPQARPAPTREGVEQLPGPAATCATTLDRGAGGGGISGVWKMPQYQRTAGRGTINGYSGGACTRPAGTYCREVPDVSADADPARPGSPSTGTATGQCSGGPAPPPPSGPP